MLLKNVLTETTNLEPKTQNVFKLKLKEPIGGNRAPVLLTLITEED